MECFVCLRSMSELKPLHDLDHEAKQIFLLISEVSHIEDTDYLCKVCHSLLQAASAFREVCAMSDFCFSRRRQAIALPEDSQGRELVQNSTATEMISVIKTESKELRDEDEENKDQVDPDWTSSDKFEDWEKSNESCTGNTNRRMMEDSNAKNFFTCDICGKTFKRFSSLHNHISQIHKRNDLQDSNTNESHHSKISRKTSSNDYKRKPHIRPLHSRWRTLFNDFGNGIAQCKYCTRILSNKRAGNMRVHILMQHKDVFNEQTRMEKNKLKNKK